MIYGEKTDFSIKMKISLKVVRVNAGRACCVWYIVKLEFKPPLVGDT